MLFKSRKRAKKTTRLFGRFSFLMAIPGLAGTALLMEYIVGFSATRVFFTLLLIEILSWLVFEYLFRDKGQMEDMLDQEGYFSNKRVEMESRRRGAEWLKRIEEKNSQE